MPGLVRLIAPRSSQVWPSRGGSVWLVTWLFLPVGCRRPEGLRFFLNGRGGEIRRYLFLFSRGRNWLCLAAVVPFLALFLVYLRSPCAGGTYFSLPAAKKSRQKKAAHTASA